jgi:hypothetical protein
MPQPHLMFENDSRHTLIYMYEPPIQKEEYESAVNELLGTPIEALVFNLGYGNAFLHATEVADRWGPQAQATQPFRPDGGEQWEHIVFQRAYRNAKKLIDEGNDPLRLICDRAAARGLLVYPTLQVQAQLDPHLSIGAGGDLDPDFPGAALADFNNKEVRDQRFALIEETLNNYPINGFELNLNHYAGGYFFHPDQVATGRHQMTEWLSRIYQAVKQSGPDRELTVRIPTSLEGCRANGLDPETWIKEGIIDVLTGENFALMSLADPTANFRPLLQIAKGSQCRVHAVIRNNLDSDRLGTAPIEMIRAVACNYWDQGIDGLHLAHWCGNWPYAPEFYEQVRELSYPEVMATKDKFYCIPTPAGRFSETPVTDPGLSMQLPAELELDKPVSLSLPISDDLPRWNQAGRVHEVILRLRLMRATEMDRLSFRLNGEELPASLVRRINHVYMMSAPRFRAHSSYWFVFKLDKAHWPIQGQNAVEVTLEYRDPEVTPLLYIRDVELEIKYLRGKSSYRGPHNTDPDLGPYEHAST